MAISPGLLKKLPFTSSIIYLAFGIFLGKEGINIIDLNTKDHSKILEVISEVTVIISLFTVGLKLRLPLRDRLWMVPISFATSSMIFTIFLIASVFYFFLGFDLGHSILIGSILSPTDPVLASEVQLSDPHDRNRIKFCLTSEGGLNDGTAFPFVMLGLGLIGAKSQDWSFSYWFTKDFIWAIFAGLGVGAISGLVISKMSAYVKDIKKSFYLEDFLTISSIALAYGFALQIHAYGFLAVFANALTIRQLEATSKGESSINHLPDEVLSFNEQLERMFEVISVGIVGLLIDLRSFTYKYVLVAIVLFFIIRPAAIFGGSYLFRLKQREKHFMSWFGVRGIGSVYYLYYAINHGPFIKDKEILIQYTLWTILFSVLLHGSTVKSMLKRFELKEVKP